MGEKVKFCFLYKGIFIIFIMLFYLNVSSQTFKKTELLNRINNNYSWIYNIIQSNDKLFLNSYNYSLTIFNKSKFKNYNFTKQSSGCLTKFIAPEEDENSMIFNNMVINDYAICLISDSTIIKIINDSVYNYQLIKSKNRYFTDFRLDNDANVWAIERNSSSDSSKFSLVKLNESGILKYKLPDSIVSLNADNFFIVNNNKYLILRDYDSYTKTYTCKLVEINTEDEISELLLFKDKNNGVVSFDYYIDRNMIYILDDTGLLSYKNIEDIKFKKLRISNIGWEDCFNFVVNENILYCSFRNNEFYFLKYNLVDNKSKFINLNNSGWIYDKMSIYKNGIFCLQGLCGISSGYLLFLDIK
ncbi:MAG: hypothetical protein KDK36_04395 [Leptospiraceae bacterium]|nr:hypothetical protein [Leptospiraceae bacterium]